MSRDRFNVGDYLGGIAMRLVNLDPYQRGKLLGKFEFLLETAERASIPAGKTAARRRRQPLLVLVRGGKAARP